MIDTILFDLDGTLLPMDQDLFIKCYSQALLEKFYPIYKEKTEQLIYTLLKSINHMSANDGKETNEEIFWQYFEKKLAINREDIEPIFLDFYNNEFKIILNACKINPLANEIIDLLIAKGYKVVLATNPFFPKVATYNRTSWAGIDPNKFELITVYENSTYCKPNIKYYEEILSKIKKDKSNCLMVGNDVLEDGIIEELGIPCFLVEDCLINAKNLEIKTKYKGNFNALYEFIKSLPNIK